MQDPKGLLRNVEWQTRDAFRKLARDFESKTDHIMRVRSARRTCAEQAEQYGIGRTYNLSSAPVTYAQGCQSWHVVGRAIDVDILMPNGVLTSNCGPYKFAGHMWENLGGVWGGTFPGFGPCGDQGHFEYHPGLNLADVCPSNASCESVSKRVDTSGPFPWTWVLGGVAVAGTLAWFGREKLRS